MDAATITLPPTLQLSIDLTDDQFFQLCQNNGDLRFERTASGKLIIMPPTGGETSNRNSELTYQIQAWSRQNKLGKSFDSNGGFTLPNNAVRAPDAAWVKLERWEALTPSKNRNFCPYAPILLSSCDRLQIR